MSFRRGHSGARRGSAPRRKTEWASMFSTSVINLPLPGNTAVINSLSAAALSIIVPATLVRMRGFYTFDIDQVAADEAYSGAIGLAVVRETARAAGIGSLPVPLTDSSEDLWTWFDFFMGRFEFIDASGIHPNTAQGVVIDNKAQRKIVDGDAIVVTAESSNFSGGVDLTFFTRLLFKLR